MPNASQKPIPVILASNALKRLWPISSQTMSYALKQQRDGLSPLQKLLSAIAKTNAYGKPLIFVQETALRFAREQIKTVYKDDVTIIATSASATSGMLCALAGVMAASNSANAQLVYLPGTLTAADETVLMRYLDLFAKTSYNKALSENEQVCFAAAPGRKANTQFSFILKNRPTRSGLSDIVNIQAHTNGHLEEQEKLVEESCRTSPIGPAIMRASLISKLLIKQAPLILQACNYALDTSEKSGNVMRPNNHFMTLCPPSTLADIVINNPENTKVLTCGNDLSVVRDWQNSLAHKPDDAPIEVQVTGSTDAQIVVHTDRILVIGENGENDVTIPKNKHERSIGESKHDSYCLEQDVHSAVWKHIIAAGNAKPNECHFHRSESIIIIAGEGIAYLDDSVHILRPGISLQIPSSVCHEINNTGSEPLIYYELRMGKMYDDDDRLYIPREDKDRESA